MWKLLPVLLQVKNRASAALPSFLSYFFQVYSFIAEAVIPKCIFDKVDQVDGLFLIDSLIVFYSMQMLPCTFKVRVLKNLTNNYCHLEKS